MIITNGYKFLVYLPGLLFPYVAKDGWSYPRLPPERELFDSYTEAFEFDTWNGEPKIPEGWYEV